MISPAMSLLLSVGLLFTSAVATAESSQRKKDKPPFKSSEDIDYVSVKTDPLIGLIKADSFQGVILRPHSPFENLRLLDDHLITGMNLMKLQTENCKEVTTRILGPADGENPVIEIKKIELFKSRFGDACEVEADDLTKDGIHKKFRLMIGLYKGQVRAFVSLDKTATSREGEVEEFRQFIKSLK